MIVKYKKFNEIIDEVQIELGSQQFMLLKPVDIVLEGDSPSEEAKIEKEIQLKIVDENIPNVITRNMKKEELKECINVLNYILAQVIKSSNIIKTQ